MRSTEPDRPPLIWQEALAGFLLGSAALAVIAAQPFASYRDSSVPLLLNGSFAIVLAAGAGVLVWDASHSDRGPARFLPTVTTAVVVALAAFAAVQLAAG